MSNKQSLDKFYTKSDIAKKYIDKTYELFSTVKWDIIIKPSVGNGSFYNILFDKYLFNIKKENIIGIDIEPDIINKEFNIIQQDYLKFHLNECILNENKKILVIGNPPFGKNSSLAIQFFNHSAEFATIIAFILPRVFRRISIQNKLNLNYHLVFDEEIPITPCAFTPTMNAKCCFQIWEKRPNKTSN